MVSNQYPLCNKIKSTSQLKFRIQSKPTNKSHALLTENVRKIKHPSCDSLFDWKLFGTETTQQREKLVIRGQGMLRYLSPGGPTLCECGSAGPPHSWWHSYVSRVTRKTRSRPHSLQNRPPRRPLLLREARPHSEKKAHLPLRKTSRDGTWSALRVQNKSRWPDLELIRRPSDSDTSLCKWNTDWGNIQIQIGKGCMKSYKYMGEAQTKHNIITGITLHLGWSD